MQELCGFGLLIACYPFANIWLTNNEILSNSSEKNIFVARYTEGASFINLLSLIPYS